MTFIAYQTGMRFTKESDAMIGIINDMITDYQSKGYSVTLRQLYYQFVARDYLPNNLKSYDKLKNVLSRGRMAGLISWSAIEDRTRNLRGLNSYGSVSEAVVALSENYRRDLWEDQYVRPEVWVEKEALLGVVGKICNELRVDFFACKGYNSQSEQWRAGKRFSDYISKGQRPVVLHLGDHDPSGLDMTRDNRERLEMFCGVPVTVNRIALNYDQIEELRPPPNPAKSTDSRFEAYREEFGDSSWELDALSPEVLNDLIKDHVLELRDEEAFNESMHREREDKEEILAMNS